MSAVGIHCETINEMLRNRNEIELVEVQSNWIGLIEKRPEDLNLDNVCSAMEIIYWFITESTQS